MQRGLESKVQTLDVGTGSGRKWQLHEGNHRLLARFVSASERNRHPGTASRLPKWRCFIGRKLSSIQASFLDLPGEISTGRRQPRISTTVSLQTKYHPQPAAPDLVYSVPLFCLPLLVAITWSAWCPWDSHADRGVIEGRPAWARAVEVSRGTSTILSTTSSAAWRRQ